MSDSLEARLRASAAPSPPLLELVERLGRELRARCELVSECPVLYDATTGRAFAAACDTDTLLLRLDTTAEWVVVDPWPQDALFRRSHEIVRDAVARAQTLAHAE